LFMKNLFIKPFDCISGIFSGGTICTSDTCLWEMRGTVELNEQKGGNNAE
jgi:hypothetical protein